MQLRTTTTPDDTGENAAIIEINKLERAAKQRCLTEIKEFRPQFFLNIALETKEKMGYLIRKTANPRRALENARRHLDIISSYRPEIEAQLKIFETSFMEQENIEADDSYAKKVLRKSENEAKQRILELEEEAYRKLYDIGSPVHIISFIHLLVSRGGWLSVENAVRYWRELEELYQARCDELADQQTN